MKLNQIRHLVAVAQGGDVHVTAEQAGVSPQTLSRSVREIEQELGTALFQRGVGPKRLTSVGMVFVRRAAAALADLDRAADELGQRLGMSAGLVSIGLSATAHALLSADVISAFRSEFPDTRIRLVEGVREALCGDVRDGILDFFMGPLRPDPDRDGLTIGKLCDQARIVVACGDNPLATATSLADLTHARWIAASSRDLRELFEHHRLPEPVIVVEAETALGMLSAVAGSDALLIMPADWWPLAAAMGHVVALALATPLDAMPIYIVTRTRLPLTPAAAYLRDLIVQAAGRSRVDKAMVDRPGEKRTEG